MVAVAIVGALLGIMMRIDRRRERFHLIAREHEKKAHLAALNVMAGEMSNPKPSKWIDLNRKRESYHQLMVGKYRMAARYSWLFNDPLPDPPEPE